MMVSDPAHMTSDAHARCHGQCHHISLWCHDVQLFDWIYIGEVGAHDGDWEHVTLRLTPDARQVLGIYYSAHRYMIATAGRTQAELLTIPSNPLG